MQTDVPQFLLGPQPLLIAKSNPLLGNAVVNTVPHACNVRLLWLCLFLLFYNAQHKSNASSFQSCASTLNISGGKHHNRQLFFFSSIIKRKILTMPNEIQTVSV